MDKNKSYMNRISKSWTTEINMASSGIMTFVSSEMKEISEMKIMGIAIRVGGSDTVADIKRLSPLGVKLTPESVLKTAHISLRKKQKDVITNLPLEFLFFGHNQNGRDRLYTEFDGFECMFDLSSSKIIFPDKTMITDDILTTAIELTFFYID